MIEDLTRQEQVELFKKWWHRYGKIALIAIIVGLAVGLGWRYWRQHQITQAGHASIIYQQLQSAAAQKQLSTAQSLSQQLMQNYSGTPYASMAALISAQEAVLQGQLNLALTQLQWVMNHADLASLQQIARLRASRILLAQKQYQSALHLLKTVNDPVYQPLIDGVTGDVYRAMGDTKLASQSYKAAQKGFAADGILDPFLEMKISQ